MNKDLIITVLSVIAFGGAIFGLYRYKKELLFKIALRYVQEAEEYFNSGEGKAKLKYVAEKIRDVTPWWIDPLISDALIEKVVNSVVDELQDAFQGTKEKQIAAVNELIKLSVTEGTQIASETVLNEIDKNGYVEGYAEVKTDLNGKNDLRAGIKAGIKL